MIVTNSQRSHDETMAQNPDAFTPRIPRGQLRAPEYFVYIHSVSKQAQTASNAYYKNVRLAGCSEGQRVTKCMEVQHPPRQVAPDEMNGGRRIYGDEDTGWRVAIDLLNPNNLSDNPYITVNPATTTAQNCDLIRKGLFPSVNEVPTETEIARAEKARDDYFRGLADEAMRLDGMNKHRELEELLNYNPDVRLAMDHFGLEASFHKKFTVKTPCPVCGEAIKPGVAFHVIPNVGACVIDWQRAVAAGVKKREDVPEDARWWEEEKRGPGRPPKVAA